MCNFYSNGETGDIFLHVEFIQFQGDEISFVIPLREVYSFQELNT